MFKRLSPSLSRPVAFFFNGNKITAEAGETIAAALLAAGYIQFRETPVSGDPRGPFCMMGACFDCLVEIDYATVQACMSFVSEGQKVTSPSFAGPCQENGNDQQ